MSKASSSDEMRTGAQAITSIQNLLRDLTGSAGLGIVSDTTSATGSTKANHPSNGPIAASLGRDHDVHKLSSVCLGRTQRALQRSLDALTASVAARESWPDVLADKLARVKSDTAAKAHVTHAANAALSTCIHLARTQDPFASKHARAVHTVQSLAERAGAFTMRDDVGTDNGTGPYKCELTVSGHNFIAVFTFATNPTSTPTTSASTSNSGNRTKMDVNVHFQFLSADAQRTDADTGASFAALLRRERFDDIKRAFDTFLRRERLSASTTIKTAPAPVPAPGAVTLCDALLAFEDTLLDASAAERKASRMLTDAERVMLGHGVVRRTALGLCVKFHHAHAATLDVEPVFGPPRALCVAKAAIGARAPPPRPPVSKQELSLSYALFPGQSPQPRKVDVARNMPVVTVGDPMNNVNNNNNNATTTNGMATATADATFVLLLQQPVLCSLAVARALDRVPRHDDPAAYAARSPPVRDISAPHAQAAARTADAERERRGMWPNLQSLLAPHIFGGAGGRGVDAENNAGAANVNGKGKGVEGGDAKASNKDKGNDTNSNSNSHSLSLSHSNSHSNSNSHAANGTAGGPKESGAAHRKRAGGRALVIDERSHWSQTSTEVVCAARLPRGRYVELSHNGADAVAAVCVRRVAVGHARDVAPVLALLRQQIVFNDLLASCFRDAVAAGERASLSAVTRQPVEVAVTDAPKALQLVMFDAAADDIVSVVVSIALDGVPAAAVKTSDGRPHPCSDAKATAALRLTTSIPLTIQAVLQVSSNAVCAMRSGAP